MNLDREAFLASHWQRKPLLIKSALPDFPVPVSADELAGLALEEAVESRIIECHDGDYRLHHGPFVETAFDRALPWTLLVQAVDHWVPEVAALRRLVNFLPGWRVDDVMLSYASDGGGVGPHYDNYDVFLLQGEGYRRWRVGQWCDVDEPLVHHNDLRILANFEEQAEYLLGPGDLLYLPPRVAHWGIAEGECTTFSIGFRAPRINDMVSRWADDALAQLEPELFYTDPGSEPVTRAGEIRRHDRERVRMQIQAALDQLEGDSWFGELVTEPRDGTLPHSTAPKQAAAGLDGNVLQATVPGEARLAWQEEDNALRLFANGESTVLSRDVLPAVIDLCDTWQLTKKPLAELLGSGEGRALLTFLINTGALDVE